MDVLELTSALVEIDSQNPGAQEPEIADFVTRWARDQAFDVSVLDPIPGRPNVIVRVHRGPGPHLGLSGHLDTKPVGDALDQWVTNPLRAEVIDGVCYGLGTSDMKGALAAMMLAAERFAHHAGGGTLDLIFTADEEQGSDAGAQALVSAAGFQPPDAIIIGEPSGVTVPWEAVHVVSRGISCFTIEVRTRQGHSGLSQRLGANAIQVAADLTQALQAFSPSVDEPGEVSCEPTVNPGIFVNGGVSWGTWPGYCEIGVEVRLVPGMDRHRFQRELQEFIDRHLAGTRATANISYAPGSQGWMPAVELSPHSAVAVAAQIAASSVLNRAVPFGAFAGGTDATYFLGAAGIPTVTSLGPGWLTVAHGPNENIAVEDLFHATEIYSSAAEEFCRSSVPSIDTTSEYPL